MAEFTGFFFIVWRHQSRDLWMNAVYYPVMPDLVIIRGAASTKWMSHGVISLKLAPQPCDISITAAYYLVMPDYGEYL